MRLEQVVVRIEGGLGNQLFQYAAARSLADRLGCDLCLDLRGLDVTQGRPFELDLYAIRARVADAALLQSLPAARPSRARRLRSALALASRGLFPYPAFWPRSFAYDARFASLDAPVYLVGYWQSERYFAWNRARLMQDLQPRAPVPPELAAASADIPGNSVGLHVRRGDYVSNPQAAQFHGVCDVAYYQAAVRLLKARHPDLHVLVFSDDLPWARAHLQVDAPLQFVQAQGPLAGPADLQRMRQCRHHVIANSSFSWWGAWLAHSPQQQVYAPARWFADAGVDTRDVLPTHWQRVASAEQGAA